jgi:hypothetical protein
LKSALFHSFLISSFLLFPALKLSPDNPSLVASRQDVYNAAMVQQAEEAARTAREIELKQQQQQEQQQEGDDVKGKNKKHKKSSSSDESSCVLS